MIGSAVRVPAALAPATTAKLQLWSGGHWRNSGGTGNGCMENYRERSPSHAAPSTWRCGSGWKC